MRVLVAEDDPGLGSVLQRSLGENGYVADLVANGRDALRHLQAYDYEVVVLDWRMPDVSGLQVLEELRRRGSRVPVLMLTAMDDHQHRITGLDRGADDYLVKPFDLGELMARLRALQRRPALLHGDEIRWADLVLDPAERRVRHDPGGETVQLTSIELSLLELLMRRAPRVVGRGTIAVQVWPDEADAVGSNTIDVHIARLRSKLASSSARIETVRGVGYRLVEARG